jgi:hypothetical protein
LDPCRRQEIYKVTINLASSTAERWVIETLSRGGPLWKLAAQRIDFSQGCFASTLPPRTDKAVTERFREEPPGIRSDFLHASTPERVVRVIRPVVDLVLEHLRADERHLPSLDLRNTDDTIFRSTLKEVCCAIRETPSTTCFARPMPENRWYAEAFKPARIPGAHPVYSQRCQNQVDSSSGRRRSLATW